MRVLPRLAVGLEWNIVVNEVDPLATFVVATESDRWPALFLGTSSDRIGSPKGKQAYYLTAAKRLHSLSVAPYASINYSEWDEGINFPFGANIDLSRGFSMQPMYDGNRGHLLASYATNRASFTLIWAWFERGGIAMSYAF